MQGLMRTHVRSWIDSVIYACNFYCVLTVFVYTLKLHDYIIVHILF